MKDGGVIQLPADDEAAALIRLDQLDQQSRILDLGFARIDLRDPDMVAVRPRERRGRLSRGAGSQARPERLEQRGRARRSRRPNAARPATG